MANENGTHWRNWHETEFLGAFDLDDRGVSEITVLITSAQSKVVKDTNGRDETILSCNFEGIDKPMILNATNCKAIEKVSGSPYIEGWAGTNVTLYVQKGIKAFGKVVDGLRIKTTKPKIAAPQQEIDDEIAHLENCSTMDELKKVFGACKHKTDQRIVSTKDKMKNVLA